MKTEPLRFRFQGGSASFSSMWMRQPAKNGKSWRVPSLILGRNRRNLEKRESDWAETIHNSRLFFLFPQHYVEGLLNSRPRGELVHTEIATSDPCRALAKLLLLLVPLHTETPITKYIVFRGTGFHLV